MKKINLLIILATIVSSFNCMKFNNTKKTYAEEIVPYGLIQPTDGYENNNTFTNAYNINTGNYKNISNNSYHSIDALISSSSDVDYFTFNLYCNTTVSIELTASSSSAITLLNYDFILYKQTNQIDPLLSTSGMTQIVKTSANGLNDYYSGTLGYGTYYIKVYGSSTSDYNNLTQYKLNVTRNKNDNRGYKDISTSYKQQNPNSYYIWKSDFQIANSNQYIGKSIDFLGYTSRYKLFDEIYNNDGFPNYGVFLWGRDLRNSLVSKINEVLEKLEELESQIESNEIIQTVINKVTNVLSFIVGGEVVDVLLINGLNQFAKFIFYLLYPKYALDVENLIGAYRTLLAATETTSDTSDTEVIYFFMDIDINKVGNVYSSTNYVSNTVSKYSILRKYDHDKLYDIMEISKGDGTYYPVYGTVSLGNPSNDLLNYI
ncbi:MAG: hypothetical protein E7177_01340 [Erysipelotrichaceae bacterium]|nr:hypothetical protein [Erysipelotrichaceae bacterium]